MTAKSTSLITVSVSLAAVFTLGSGEALAACTPEIWPKTDTPYITRCDDDQDIRIDLNDVDITATVSGTLGYGIFGSSQGNPTSGDVTINVRGGSVKTSGRRSHGIRGESRNGNVTVNVEDVSITTDSTTDTRQDRPSIAISAVINDPRADSPDGKISVTAKDVTILTSGGRGSHGIYGFNSSKRTDNPDADTDIDIDIEDSSITTEGSSAHGILGEHTGDGNVNIDVRGSRITSGDYHGIYGLRALSGDRADTTGDINIDARDSIITTKAYLGHGIYARNEGITKTIYDYTVEDYVSYVVSNGPASGDIHIDVEGVTITTESTNVDPDTLRTESHGIYGRHLGEGDIHIDAQDGTTITTMGVNSYGIYGYHEDVPGDGTPGSNGDINIDVRDSSITTFGEGSHGILAEHDSGMGFIDILVKRGAIHASGTGASGVRVGTVNASNFVERVAGFDAEGYRDQTVTVNGRVMGNEAGVYLAGGGRVVIGPKGSVGAKSGIAILATGDTPKLRVDMNLGGRRVAQAIGNNWIINDGGETTIAVNRTVLHDGANGVVRNAVAANGAWNVTMREHGVKVDDSTADRVNWTFTPSTDVDKITEDRDFSVQDFMQAIAGRTQMARTQCSDTLDTQTPITNEEEVDSTTDLSVNADGVKISATGALESGIDQVHRGEGDITVNVRSSCIETTGNGSRGGDAASGILASSDSATDPATNVGDVKIDVRDSTITTQGGRTKGIVGVHIHTGDVDIDVENTAITTEGQYAHGVHGFHRGSGKVDIDVENSTITTPGQRSHGIYGIHAGTGDINLNVNNTTINALGQRGSGVYGQQHRLLGTGSVNIILNNVDLMSKNTGVYGYTDGLGDTIIDVQNSAITAENIAIYVYHVGGLGDLEVGLIDIDVRDTILTTTTDDGKAIYAFHGFVPVVGDTEVDIENTIITTYGADADGIFGRHQGKMVAGAFDINVLNGSVIHAIGDGSSGVRVGSLNNNGEVIDAGGIGDDGYRLHNILIDGQVTGNLAGVYLAGGGRVVIGPKGSVGAKSGIAILATGDTPGANPGEVIKPKLRVDMNLAGRRVAQAMAITGSSTMAVRPPSQSTERFCMMGLTASLDGLQRTAPGTSGCANTESRWMTQRQTVLTGRSPRALMSTRSLKIGTSQFRTSLKPPDPDLDRRLNLNPTRTFARTRARTFART